MISYQDKLIENERTITRWLIRLKRASNKIEKLRRQRANLLRRESKELVKEATAIEITPPPLAPVPPKPKPKKKPERRINL